MNKKDLVKSTEDMAKASREFSQTEKFEDKNLSNDSTVQLTKKEMVDPDVHKITPNRRIRGTGKPNPKWEKERAHSKEFVIGVLENRIVLGEKAHFWKNNFPGDDYEEWIIPCGIPVAIPRHVANHVHNNCKYHTFKYRQKQPHEVRVNDFDSKFEVIETKKRLDFQPLKAFG